MLIIGHRGAAGEKHENTIEALRAGQDADVDILEFDVRITKDNVPVLIHDLNLWRTHKLPYMVHQLTLDELLRRTSQAPNPITTLEAVLDEFGGNILLNLELKDRGSAALVAPIIKRHIKKSTDWESYLFSSFQAGELRVMRSASKKAQLALLEWYNPLRFLVADRELSLTAVGFHRLHINPFVVAAAKKIGLFIYVHTVNHPRTLERLYDMEIDGIVTDVPTRMRTILDRLETSGD